MRNIGINVKKSAIRIPAFRPRFAGVHLFRSSKEGGRSFRANEMAELVVVTHGAYRATLPGRSPAPLEARVGDVVFWPEGAARTEECDATAPTRCFAIYFRWSNAPRNFPRMVHDHDRVIRLLAERMLVMRDFPEPIPSAVWDSFTGAMLAECLRLDLHFSNDLTVVVSRYIEEHIADPIRVTDLARVVGLDSRYFIRKYKTLTGESPMHHVRRRRVEHAIGMLIMNPGRKLQDVALRVGVGDERHLRQLIARYANTSIRDLRQEGLRSHGTGGSNWMERNHRAKGRGGRSSSSRQPPCQEDGDTSRISSSSGGERRKDEPLPS